MITLVHVHASLQPYFGMTGLLLAINVLQDWAAGHKRECAGKVAKKLEGEDAGSEDLLIAEVEIMACAMLLEDAVGTCHCALSRSNGRHLGRSLRPTTGFVECQL